MLVRTLKSMASAVQNRWLALRDRDDVQRGLKFIQYGLLALIVVYLVFKLSRVGWLEVLGALPESPWFYFFFLLRQG